MYNVQSGGKDISSIFELNNPGTVNSLYKLYKNYIKIY